MQTAAQLGTGSSESSSVYPLDSIHTPDMTPTTFIPAPRAMSDSHSTDSLTKDWAINMPTVVRDALCDEVLMLSPTGLCLHYGMGTHLNQRWCRNQKSTFLIVSILSSYSIAISFYVLFHHGCHLQYRICTELEKVSSHFRKSS